MAANTKPGSQATIQIPQITNFDLQAFHQKHFSKAATQNFAETFLYSNASQQPVRPAAEHLSSPALENKSPRHLDMENSRLQADLDIENFPPSVANPNSFTLEDMIEPEAEQASEVAGEEPLPKRNAGSQKKRKRTGRNKPQAPKPDLRKRTWDVVDSGLDSLNYD